MGPPNRLLEAAQEIQLFCRSHRWRFCFIGGLAVQHWGEARLTRDADLTLFTGIGDEPRYVDELLGHFASRIGLVFEALRPWEDRFENFLPDVCAPDSVWPR